MGEDGHLKPDSSTLDGASAIKQSALGRNRIWPQETQDRSTQAVNQQSRARPQTQSRGQVPGPAPGKGASRSGAS